MDDALRVRPSTVADALNDLPQFSGSRAPDGQSEHRLAPSSRAAAIPAPTR